MRKFIGYVPAILFTVFVCFFGLFLGSLAMPSVLIWLVCFWFAALGLHKGMYWGSVFGILPALHMIYTNLHYEEKFNIAEISVAGVLMVFYIIYGVYLWKKRDTIKVDNSEVITMAGKILSTAAAFLATFYFGLVFVLTLLYEGFNTVLTYISVIVTPSLLFPVIWLKKRKKFLQVWLILAVVYCVALGVNYGMIKYDEKITVDVSPNINVDEYMPFEEESKIVKHDSQTLRFTDNLPRIDGAAALFPVYSAFVNATYPDTTEFGYNKPFQYNNTPNGYRLLAEKQTDIFIGVYPSDEQKAYAQECGTTFCYTPVGNEGFVFFVHKDNPIENLTTEQIRGIYSGEITNWKQVGGKNEKIEAFQRNEGSGSQSMLLRFMGDVPLMEAPKEMVNDLMSGIIEQVSDYKSKSNSIGFSFRYYVEGIIKNPDIKMISVDGVAPVAENIRNGKYPIVTPIYAVTYEEQTNENVGKLLDWILSVEGQRIIEETGYVGISEG